jgi:hypothetical protein
MDGILINLGVLALSLGIAGVLITRSRRAWLGVVLGLVPIVLWEVWLQLEHSTLTQQCIERVCSSAGLPPGCSYGRDGCSEEEGLRALVFWGMGFINLCVYAIGVALMTVIQSRRSKRIAARSGPPSDVAS